MKKIKYSGRAPVIIGAILLTVILALVGGTAAKYVSERNEIKPVTSAEFYFESDYLTANNKSYMLNSDIETITFQLFNFENEHRISEIACNYTITITSEDTEFTVTTTPGEDAGSSTDNGVTTKTLTHTATLNGNDPKQDTLTVTLSDLTSGNTYTVTAISTGGGYEKILSATFEVRAAKPTGAFMHVEQTAHYVLLTVWTEKLADTNTGTITVPAGLTPDATDPILGSNTNVRTKNGDIYTVTDTSSFAVGESRSRSYRFFITGDYDPANLFTVKFGETPATPADLPQ